MGLRNAFEEIGLEATLRKILAAVTYARTPIDQMRVVVDSGSITTASGSTTVVYTGQTATAPASAVQLYYNNTSWNVVDAREPLREASEQHFVLTRNRWSIT